MTKMKRVYIEISNICNLQCSFCPVVERDKEVLAVADFERILVQAAPLAEEVCLHLMGEPLAHPKLREILGVIDSNAAKVQITTNGILIRRYQEDLLGTTGLRQINFSIQSFLDNFPDRKIEDYLNRILEFCKEAMAERPDLYMNFRLWNLESAQDNEPIFEYLEESLNLQIPRAVDVGHIKSKRLVGRLYLHFDSRFEWPSLEGPVRSSSGRCHALKDHIGIHANGVVVPCCLDKEAVVPLGNCLTDDLGGILIGQRAMAMKAGFAQGQLVEDLCKRCTYIERFDKRSR